MPRRQPWPIVIPITRSGHGLERRLDGRGRGEGPCSHSSQVCRSAVGVDPGGRRAGVRHGPCYACLDCCAGLSAFQLAVGSGGRGRLDRSQSRSGESSCPRSRPGRSFPRPWSRWRRSTRRPFRGSVRRCCSGQVSGCGSPRPVGSRPTGSSGWPGRCESIGSGTAVSGQGRSLRRRLVPATGPCRRRRTCSTAWLSMSGAGMKASFCIGRGVCRLAGVRPPVASGTQARRARLGEVSRPPPRFRQHVDLSWLLGEGCQQSAICGREMRIGSGTPWTRLSGLWLRTVGEQS